MTLLVAMLLAQGCDANVQTCLTGPLQSRVPIFQGSGVPDIILGDADTQKYGLIETRQRADACINHGDLTVAAKYARSCGYLQTWQNPYFGSGAIVCSVAYDGSIFSWGNINVAQNGAGLRNASSYVGNYGRSPVPWIADVVEGPLVPHFDAAPTWCAFTGYEFPLCAQGDGFVRLSGVPLKVVQKDEGIQFVVQLSDGGTRTALAGWQ